MLDAEQSRQRQKRLLDVMAKQRLDAIAVAAPHHVYYLSTHLPNWLHFGGFILLADGRSVLIAAAKPPTTNVAADEVIPYDARWNATLRPEQSQAVAQQI